MKLTRAQLQYFIQEERHQENCFKLYEGLYEGPPQSLAEAEEGRLSMIDSFKKVNEILDSLSDRLAGL